MNKLVSWLILFVFSLVGVIWLQWPSDDVVATVCDVGQGDGLVISRGFSQMVIDVGLDNGQMNDCLGKTIPFWDRNLEVVVITHADNDHMGGLSRLLEAYQVGKILTTQATEQKMRGIVGSRGEIVSSWQGQRLSFGDITGEVLWPKRISNIQLPISNKIEDTNRESLVLRLEIQGKSLWLAGDADTFVEEQLIENNLVKKTDYLKVGHHGSRTSTSEPFLAILKPNQVWVSVGKNNNYRLPSPEVIKRFEHAGLTILRTDQMGTFTVHF